MTEIISKNIDAVGCCLHCLEAGRPEDRTVLLLHGMKFYAATWQELGTLEKLAGAGFHPVAVDMPGFGESPVCDKDQDEILSAFISQGELNRPVMIGPSMGGRIALEFAVNHPGILGGLVLVGAVGVEENRERLAEIDIPVLIIWGGEDRISPLANCDILLESIKGAERLVIDGAPHPCYLDQPDRWHGAVLDFLNGL
jgi:abhydrolase domain-containing protein 14